MRSAYYRPEADIHAMNHGFDKDQELTDKRVLVMVAITALIGWCYVRVRLFYLHHYSTDCNYSGAIRSPVFKWLYVRLSPYHR